MDFETRDHHFHSKSPETIFGLSLVDHSSEIKIDFSENPNLIIEIEELRDVVGVKSSAQAGLLINQDDSCWITNLGRSGSTEVYRPIKKTHRKLAHNQVAYLQHGDYIGFYGSFFRVEFEDKELILIPADSSAALQVQ